MLGKNNTQARREKMGNKVYKYAIKRLSVGVASVAVAAGILFSSQEQVAQAASETGVEATTPGDTSSADAAQPEAEAPTDPVAQPGEETTAAPGAEEATGKPAEADAPTEEAPAPEASTATPAEDDKLPEGAVNTAEPEAAPADGSVEEPVQPEVKPASSIEPKNLIEKGEEGETVKTRNEVEPRANELTFGKDKDGNIISKEASEAVANKSELAEAKSYEWVKSPEIGDTKAHVKVTYNDGSYDILEVNVQTPNRPEDEPGSNVITSGGTSEADAIEATGNDPRASFTYQGRAWIENEPSFGGGPDDGDQPVAGQKIYLQWRDHKGIISPIFYTTTKADGTFIFDLSRPVLNADGSMTKFTLTGLNGAKTGVRTWAEPLEGYSVVKSGDMYGARFQTRLDRTQENWDFTVGVERIVGGVVQYQRKPNVEGWLAKPESEWVRPDTTDGYWPDNGNYGVMRGKVWYENNETNGGVTNEYLGQPGNGDVWATGMEVVGSYVNDEVARQFDQWRDNNKGYTHDQFKQAQKDIIAAYEAEHGKGSAIAETVVGKVDKDGNYRIPFRGLYGVSRNRQNAPAQISNKITDEEFGELVRDEEVNHSDSRVWDGIVNLRNRHINYDYSYVYPLVGNNDVWMKMYEDNMFQSSYSIGGQLNAGTNISGIQFAILAAQPVHDVTNKDTNENWAKPGDTAESHTKGLHPNQVYKVRWFKDGEAIGEAVEMRSDNLGEFGSVPITVSDDLTDDSVYTSAVFTANDKADNLANALYVDSFIARPVVKKVNQADPVKKGYARVTFLPGEDGAFDNGSGAVYYDVLENYTLKEAQEAAKNSAVPLEIPNVTPADNVYPFQGWKLNTNNKFSSLDATSVKLKDLADADAKLQNGVPVTFVAGYAKEKDAAKYTPAYAETAGEVGKEAKSAAPTFTDKDGKAATPKVNSYKLGEGAPAGATIDEATGVVTYTPTEADAGKTVEVPVVVTYADDSTDNVKAPIKVAQLDDVIDRTDDPSKPTPEGYVRVTLDAGEGAKLKDGQTKKVYDVKKGKSLAENQYPQVEVDPAKKNDYKDPITWTVAPGTPINEQTDIVANATKTEANTNEPVGKDQTVKVGEPVDSDKSIENLTDLPAGTKTSFKEPVDTTTEGQKDATVVVTYPDGSTDEVPVKVNVEKNPTQADTNTPVGKDQTVKVGEPVDSDKSIENLTDLPAGTKTSFKEPVDTTTEGQKDATVVVTYPDGSTDEVPVKVNVEKNPTQADTNTPVGKDQTVKVGEPVDSDKSIENLTDLPAGTKTSFKEPVDTTTEGQKDATVVVTYPDGSTDEVPVKVNVEKNPTQADTNTPVGKDQTVKVGEPVDSDKSIENLKDLPAGTKTSFKEPVDTTTEGQKDATVVVTYPDGSTDEVPVKVNVEKNPTQADTNTPVGKDQTVKVGEPVDSDKSIENLKDLPAGTKTSFKEPVDTTTEGQKDATVVVTYPDGSTDEVPVKVNVEKNPTQADTNTPVGKDQTVKVGEPVDSDKSIENLKDLPAGTKTSFKEPVDTTTEGQKDATVVVTYPDGSTDEVPVKVNVKKELTQADETTPTVPADKTPVEDKNQLTQDEKDQVKKAIEDANKDTFPAAKDGQEPTKVEVDDKGNATITYPDGSKDTIPSEDLIREKTKVTGEAKEVEPTDKEQATGLRVENQDKGTPTKVTAKDEDGNNVPVTVDKDGNILVTPGTKVDGPITVTVEDQDLPGGKKDFEVPVKGHEKGRNDNGTSVDDSKVTPVDPTDEKQGTGIIVNNPDKDTKVTAKDEDGKDVPVEINPETGEVEVTPGTKVDGPITVIVEDPDLPGGKKEIEVPVNGHEKGRDDNGSDKTDAKTSVDQTGVKPVNPTDDKQGTGIIVNNPDKDTKVTAKDEDGNDVPVVINPETGEVEVTPGTKVDGPITVIVEDPELPGGKVEITVPVVGHEAGRDDNGSDKTDKATTVDQTGVKPVNPTDDKQGTGIIVNNPDKDTKVTAKDEDGKDVPVVINPETGEIEVTPGTNVDGPITVIVEDPELPGGKVEITVPVVVGHEAGRDDNAKGAPSQTGKGQATGQSAKQATKAALPNTGAVTGLGTLGVVLAGIGSVFALAGKKRKED